MRINDVLLEFAPDSNDGGEDDALRNYARMWWAGDEATQMQIERALAKMGWEIGEDEGGYDNGGVFVVRAGDENGNSYQSWAAEDLTEGLTEVDRRGFLKGLGAAAVAGAAGGVATKADAQEVTQWTKYATDLATRTMGRIHQDTGYDLRNWLVTNVGNWVSDYCRQTNSYNAKNVIDTCNQQAYEASGLDKENKLVSAFLTNMKNRYQDFLNAYRAGISEAYQKYNSALQSQQQQKSAMGNLGKEEFDVLIDALIVYAICKDRQLDNSDLFKAVAASIKRFIDANNAKDYVNSIYPKAKQSVEVLKNNPELYQKESAQFFRNAGSTIEKLDRLSSNKKPEFESVNQGMAEGIDDEEYGPELAALKKEFGKFTQHYDRMDQDSAYAAQWRKQNTDRLNREVPDDEDTGDIGDEMGQDMGDDDNVREGNLNTKYSLKNMFGDVKSLDNLSLEQLNKAMDGRVNIVGRKFRGQEGNSFRYDVKLDNGNSYIMHIIYVHGLIDAWLTDEENNKIPLSKVKPQGVAEGKPREKEADYGADYQDMVSRVKKLAGLGPLKTVYDPQKRVYKNVPRAEQPKKEQR